MTIGNLIFGTGIDGENATISSGNIGIGTSTPIGKFNVQGAAVGKALTILNETGNQAILVASASGTNRFIIQNDGNVGVGTSSPAKQMHIYSTSSSPGLRVQNANYSLDAIISSADGNPRIVTDAPAINFYTGTSNERFRIADNADGNGYSSAGALDGLYVTGKTTESYPASIFQSANAAQTGELMRMLDSSARYVGQLTPVSSSNSRLKFLLYNTQETTITDYERLAIYPDSSNSIFRIEAENGGSGTLRNLTLQAGGGNVGIGTTSPIGRLNVSGAAVGKALTILNETGNQNILAASASGVAKLVVNRDGNIGIGTSSPISALHIASGAIRIGTNGDCNNDFCLDDNSLDTFYDFTITNHNTGNLFLMPDSNVGVGTTTPLSRMQINSTGAQLRLAHSTDAANDFTTFTTNTSGNLTIVPNGGTVQITGDMVPTTNATYNLGNNSGQRWDNLYLDTSVIISDEFSNAAQITISSGDGLTFTGADYYEFKDSAATTFFSLLGTLDVGTSGSNITLNPVVATMDNSDSITGMNIDITNADHSGSNNVLRGLYIDGITADAQAVETALVVGAGWDYGATFQNNVGIGTTTPGELLTVQSATGAYGLHHTDGTVNLKTYIGSNYAKLTTTGNHSLRFGFNGTAEMLILDSTGNMGYADTTPDSLFEISGTGTADTEMLTISSVSANDGDLLTFTRTGNLGIGSTAPIGLLNVSGAAVGKALTILNETGNQNILVASASGTNVFVLQRDGNVGINTSAPIHALEVNGNIAVEQYLYHRGDTDTSFRFGNDQWQITAGGLQFAEFSESTTDVVTFNGNNVDIDFVVDGDTNEGAFFVDGSTENVGIGTISPGARLHLTTNAADFAAEFYNDGNATTRSGLLVQGGLDDHTAAGPSTLIHFNDGDGGTVGTITFGSSLTNYNTTSDARLKNDNGVSTKGLPDLLSIVVHDYSFKADPTNKVHTGFMAQELYSIYPDAVTAYTNSNEYWQVDYGKLTPLIVRSIQEQQAQIVALQLHSLGLSETGEVVLSTQARVSNLEDEVAALQQGTHFADDAITARISEFFGQRIEFSEAVTTFIQKVVFTSKVTFAALVEFASDVTFRSRVLFADKDMAGFAKIKQGDSEVRVTFEKPFLFDPVVTLSAYDPNLAVGLTDVSKYGFTIITSVPAASDQKINWVALLVLEPKTIESAGNGGVIQPFVENPETEESLEAPDTLVEEIVDEVSSDGQVAGEATTSGESTDEATQSAVVQE